MLTCFVKLEKDKFDLYHVELFGGQSVRGNMSDPKFWNFCRPFGPLVVWPHYRLTDPTIVASRENPSSAADCDAVKSHEEVASVELPIDRGLCATQTKATRPGVTLCHVKGDEFNSRIACY